MSVCLSRINRTESLREKMRITVLSRRLSSRYFAPCSTIWFDESNSVVRVYNNTWERNKKLSKKGINNTVLIRKASAR